VDFGFPQNLTWYRLLTDWGSIIGGVLALIAGTALYVIGRRQAKAIMDAADKEIATTKDAMKSPSVFRYNRALGEASSVVLILITVFEENTLPGIAPLLSRLRWPDHGENGSVGHSSGIPALRSPAK